MIKRLLIFLFIIMSTTVHAGVFKEKIQKSTVKEQKEMFRYLLTENYYTCDYITYIFYKGKDHKGNEYWTVTADNKNSYLIRVQEAKKYIGVTPCHTARALGLECFQTMEDQHSWN